ncbi:FadR family transcriptional regulator [Alteromonas aestuariivivens]|uniref:FadR family transcriptional regulator n=1 Tax=Alteromonas aestuariivivens TaxID=1938339 RepID=A0A3D8MEG5_9ALTE|nr:FadR/GntR family transcriptional regulator [Alteromonas aestuariivivens]RDV29153.1 FadR family transcriptional regulator [Alteromonas aestuariivivens]
MEKTQGNISLGRVSSSSLTSELTAKLRSYIQSQQVKVGDKLPTEKAIAEEAGVSRTVVREALARLSAEGLIDVRRGVGVYVLSKSPSRAFHISSTELNIAENACQLLEIRMAVETEMAGLAAERRTESMATKLQELQDEFGARLTLGESLIDEDFQLHLCIAEASQNSYFERFLQFIGKQMIPDRTVAMAAAAEHMTIIDYLHLIHEEHQDIVDAIISQDKPAAQAAARKHIGNSLQRYRKVLKNKA